jgi:xanthine dehydrogenase YagR molybdenum-binding subunit
MPEAPVSGGSMTAASVGPAVQQACLALREKIAAAAVADPESPLYRADAAGVTVDAGAVASADGRREPLGRLAARAPAGIEAAGSARPGEEEKKLAARSFGAVFAEVRVDEPTGVIRVPRIVAAYSLGRLMNRKTAISQLQGGIVWGLGQALFEDSVLDRSHGRIVNGNLAEYHVPVNADVGALEIDVVDEDDQAFSPLGGRGIGEIGITGVAAAVANAVYHATGRRVRSLPITLDKLIGR